MSLTPRALAALAFFISGCAGSRLEPTVAPSSDNAGYAVGYSAALDGAAERLQRDKQRAHELSAALPAHARELKPGGDPDLLLRVVDEADAAGRAERLRSAFAEERAVQRFWDEERSAIGSRVTSATQKQIGEDGCKDVDVQGSIGPALRDGVDRQLERRVRAANEAQRTIEQHKARLAPGTLPAVQRLADEIAVSSHLAHVALVDDVRELDRLLKEQRSVDKALARALDDERAIQADPRNAADQRASQERVVQIEKSRASVAPSVQRAELAIRDYEKLLDAAEREHEVAVDAIETDLRTQRDKQTAPPKS
jgi:hypothetical protein